MEEPSTTELVHKYLDQAASDADLAELERRIIARPESAEAFASACRMDAWLRTLLQEEGQIRRNSVLCLAAELRRRATRRRWRTLGGVAAAVSILIICFGAWRLFDDPPSKDLAAHRPATAVLAEPPPSKRGIPNTGAAPAADNTPVAAAMAIVGIFTANAVK